MPSLRLASLAALLLLAAAAGPGSAHAASVKQLRGKAGCFQMDGKRGCKKGRGTEFVSATAVSPDGRHVYAASGIGSFGALLVFKRNRKTGALTQLSGKNGCISSTGRDRQVLSAPVTCAKAPGLPQANDVAISRDGRTVYTLAQAGFDDGQAVDVWRRSPATGRVTLLQCLTANAGQPGCEQAPINLPTRFALARGGKQLVLGGLAITTFPVGDDGRLGAGTCRYKLEANPGNLCQDAPRLGGVRGITRMSTPRGGRTVYAVGGEDFEDTDDRGQVVALKIAADGGVSVRSCAGDGLGDTNCRSARALRAPSDVAAAPDGRGVYTASANFVVTDEEEGDGYYASSAVGVFRSSLRQLGGRRGCVLFRGKNAQGCARAPKSRRPGFYGANAIGVSPNGRRVLAGFAGNGSVALLRRNRKSQALTPVRGRGGCVVDRRARTLKSCAKGHGIGAPNAVAFSRNGRSAYVATEAGLSVYAVR